jgi:peptidoglycan/xylan/chitin deacetylase (PgdA/CDA1 family)
VKSLALTFDDGPDPIGTPAVLDALSRAAATATFFVIAPRAAEHPEIVARAIQDGHTVGLHCDEHVRHGTRDAGWGRADTERALARLAELGIEPTLWRTPWGDTAPWTQPLAEEHGLRLVGWTADSHDWRGDDAASMFAATRDGLHEGAIVLAHDGLGPGARRQGLSETVDYLWLVAGHARTQGLELAAL